MPCQLNREAYQSLINDDLAWLKRMPRTLERDHIEATLKYSVVLLYPPTPEDRDPYSVRELNRISAGSEQG